MKRFIIGTLLTSLISVCFVSCNDEEPETPRASVITYETNLCICFENMTQRELIIEHNLSGTIVKESVEPLCKLPIVTDYVLRQYTAGVGYTEIVSGSTSYTADFNEWESYHFGWKYIKDYHDDSYVRVYDTDLSLIKEWRKEGYISSIKDPFKYDYYTYTREEQTNDNNSEYKYWYEWRFNICEWLLATE